MFSEIVVTFYILNLQISSSIQFVSITFLEGPPTYGIMLQIYII